MLHLLHETTGLEVNWKFNALAIFFSNGLVLFHTNIQQVSAKVY